MADWTDVVGVVGGSVGVLTSVGTTIWTVRRAHKDDEERQAAAAENQRQHDATAAIAHEAAQSAAKSAAEAQRLADVQVASRHEALVPSQRSVRTRLDRSNMGINLFGALQVDRDYRARAFAAVGNTTWGLGVPTLLTANKVHDFHLERWPDGTTAPQIETVILKLWPPTSDDPVEHWSCACGRPLVEGTNTDPGHWEIRLPVEPPPPEPFFAAERR